MPIEEKVLTRELNKFTISNANDGGLFLEGSTKRRVVFSDDKSLIGFINNFTIDIYQSESLNKIYSFKLVSETEGKQILEKNKNLEEMISQIQISDTAKYDAIMMRQQIELEFIQEIGFSPDNKYICSINKIRPDKTPNVFIREIESNKIVYSQTRNNFNTEHWPIFQWFKNSKVFSFLDKGTIYFIDSTKKQQNSEEDKKVQETQEKQDSRNIYMQDAVCHCSSFSKDYALKSYSICKNGDKFCVFFKSRNKNKSSMVHIFNYPEVKLPIFKKPVLAETVDFIWSNNGRTLMLKSSINTLKSYYMVSKLSVVRFSGGANGKSICTDIMLGDSTLLDCCFSNKGDNFAVIAYKPVSVKLFRTDDCKIVHEFEPFNCNRIIWSPNDKFAWIAGVLNMSGKMSFWDMKNFKCLGRGEHQGARSYSWSSDSRFFITAVLSPWRKVDNGFKIWSCFGKLMRNVQIENLFQCSFINRPLGSSEGFNMDKMTPEDKKLLKGGPKAVAEDEIECTFKLPYRMEIKKDHEFVVREKQSAGNKKTSAPRVQKKIFGIPQSMQSTKTKKPGTSDKLNQLLNYK